MVTAITVLNELESSGLILRYGLGEAMGALFYAEPVSTFDLDVFILLPEQDSPLLTLAPLYQALAERGYHADAEYVMIEGIPLQFLPAYNDLLREALSETVAFPYESVHARVLRAEHLIAICVDTGRSKDRDRVRQLLEQADIDQPYLYGVLERHNLSARWKQWTE
jgi:hypothetical protein